MAHVVVNTFAQRKSLQTCPTGVRFAAGARHMVTAIRLLDKGLASRAPLDVVQALPFLEQPVDAFVSVLARRAFVILDVAVRTDPADAVRAGHDRVLRPEAVDLRAVGRRAVKELVGPRLDVGGVRGVSERVELAGEKDVARRTERNELRAGRVLAEAAQRE